MPEWPDPGCDAGGTLRGATPRTRPPEAAIRSIVLSIVMILGLSACGSDATVSGADEDGVAAESLSESSNQRSNPSAKAGGAAVPEELSFTAETIEGASFDGSSLAGKDAVLWFWAPWCTECRREAPFVAASQSDNPDVLVRRGRRPGRERRHARLRGGL